MTTLSVALVAITAWATLLLQTWIDLQTGDPLAQTVWTQARFFTNLTILLVALIYSWVWARGWPGASLPAGLTVWIVLTGVIYHALLAADHNPEGWDILVNILQHTGLPVLVFAVWRVFAPKAGLTWHDAVYWTAWPLAYAIYGLLRGLSDGEFPYFFLNPDKTGWGGVGLYILGIGALFFMTGLALLGLAKLRRK